MPKPKGGRGKAAPYATRQVRVPEPVIPQVDQLINMYQDYLEGGGDATNPPVLFVSEREKLVNWFIQDRERSILILEEVLNLKANAGGAIKEKIREVLQILKS